MSNLRSGLLESTLRSCHPGMSRFGLKTCWVLLFVCALRSAPAVAQCDVYVANRELNSVSVFDTLTDTLKAEIPVGNQPLRIAITPDRAFAYVTNTARIGLITSNTVAAIDTTTALRHDHAPFRVRSRIPARDVRKENGRQCAGR